jgi:cob(I)alamin adenosyltransferase
MKIYTRTGDKGETSLLGGARVPKHHARIEAYGTVDELNSHLGLLRDVEDGLRAALLVGVQQHLFDLGSRLAATSEEEADRFNVPAIAQADINALEKAMDEMDADLPPMRNFVLPGGHPTVSQAHICRTVCRRAERCVVALAGLEPIPEVAVRYLNRLSDMLFVLARWYAKHHQAQEIIWKPRDQ